MAAAALKEPEHLFLPVYFYEEKTLGRPGLHAQLVWFDVDTNKDAISMFQWMIKSSMNRLNGLTIGFGTSPMTESDAKAVTDLRKIDREAADVFRCHHCFVNAVYDFSPFDPANHLELLRLDRVREDQSSVWKKIEHAAKVPEDEQTWYGWYHSDKTNFIPVFARFFEQYNPRRLGMPPKQN